MACSAKIKLCIVCYCCVHDYQITSDASASQSNANDTFGVDNALLTHQATSKAVRLTLLTVLSSQCRTGSTQLEAACSAVCLWTACLSTRQTKAILFMTSNTLAVHQRSHTLANGVVGCVLMRQVNMLRRVGPTRKDEQ